jgi:hypothetical protein
MARAEEKPAESVPKPKTSRVEVYEPKALDILRAKRVREGGRVAGDHAYVILRPWLVLIFQLP